MMVGEVYFQQTKKKICPVEKNVSCEKSTGPAVEAGPVDLNVVASEPRTIRRELFSSWP
jgi:hypothetical protein